MNCAETVKKIRRAYLMDIGEFAELVGMNRQSIWSYENDKAKPRMKSVRKLMELAKKKRIKVTMDNFLD